MALLSSPESSLSLRNDSFHREYVSYWITAAFDLALLLHSVTGTSADGYVLGIGGLEAVDVGQILGRVALAVLGPAITDVGQQNNNS